MKVKELIAVLSTFNPDALVVGYCKYSEDDFLVGDVVTDKVVDMGYSDGFTKEYCLDSFYCEGESVCRNMPLGTEVVVIH